MAQRRNLPFLLALPLRQHEGNSTMGGLIYLIGLIVVVMFILSVVGLR